MKRLYFILFALLVGLVSCKKGDDEQLGDVITTKIMYDVPIVNLRIDSRTTDDPNWFWENLPYPDGDKYIDRLYADARDGKITLYFYDLLGDYEHLEKMSKSDVKKLFEEEMTVSLPVPDYYDEVEQKYVSRPNIDFPLDAQHIFKLRFLEQWYDNDGKIVKKVLAVAPVFTINVAPTDGQDGYEMNCVKFWMMADDKLLK
ncbi:MAG: hypothetical protein HUK15_08450 [Bacteroidales bacterium]|nr:hypothetical protein [Bacteroidales bacterium]